MRCTDFKRLVKIVIIFNRGVTFDLDSGLGVTVPSTLLFILLFISGLEAMPRNNGGE